MEQLEAGASHRVQLECKLHLPQRDCLLTGVIVLQDTKILFLTGSPEREHREIKIRYSEFCSVQKSVRSWSNYSIPQLSFSVPEPLEPVLYLKTKDWQSLTLTFETTGSRDFVEAVITKKAFWEGSGLMTSLEAFQKSDKAETDTNPTVFYSIDREFYRLGLDSKSFVLSDINHDYSLCSTYPTKLIFPKGVNDQLMKESAACRSSHRLPTVCWVNSTGNILARSSQPLLGLGQVDMSPDYNMLRCFFGPQDPQRQFNGIYIVDARSQLAAGLNFVKGGGYETGCPDSILSFHNIANIHKVRSSFLSLVDLFIGSSKIPERKAVEATQWLLHIQSLLEAATQTTLLLQENSVLVHCSDGWDRTAQIVSLAQVLMDPHFRTIIGFGHLIQKEWLLFGHRFSARMGHGQSEGQTYDQSPIFLQFIDCIYQILKQHPSKFEFNETYLVALLDAVYNGRFGTFLCNSEREREGLRLKSNTRSVWTWLTDPKRIHKFRNGAYERKKYDVSSPRESNIIIPTSSSLEVWLTYYARHSKNLETVCKRQKIECLTCRRLLSADTNNNLDYLNILKETLLLTRSEIWDPLLVGTGHIESCKFHGHHSKSRVLHPDDGVEALARFLASHRNCENKQQEEYVLLHVLLSLLSSAPPFLC
eukprot:TRINITY_DN6114_c0_g1_i1.p1 TRINITY_DN6114_c0_g1~~TRINITY_DN6114_c0_g1_i1.p1  ORF type:complete len:662 (-),score=55.45 TRINITY_DN6114_c0_g1_i1:18-1961(-)